MPSNLLLLLSILPLVANFYKFCLANNEIYVEIDNDWTENAHAEYAHFINQCLFASTVPGAQSQCFQVSMYMSSAPTQRHEGVPIITNEIYRFSEIPDHWFLTQNFHQINLHQQQQQQAGSSQRNNRGKRKMTEAEEQHIEQAAAEAAVAHLKGSPEIVLEIKHPKLYDNVIRRKFHLKINTETGEPSKSYTFSILPEQWECKVGPHIPLGMLLPGYVNSRKQSALLMIFQRLPRGMGTQEIEQRLSNNAKRQERFRLKLGNVHSRLASEIFKAQYDINHLEQEVRKKLVYLEEEYQLQHQLLQYELLELRKEQIRRNVSLTMEQKIELCRKLKNHLLEISWKKQLPLLSPFVSNAPFLACFGGFVQDRLDCGNSDMAQHTVRVPPPQLSANNILTFQHDQNSGQVLAKRKHQKQEHAIFNMFPPTTGNVLNFQQQLEIQNFDQNLAQLRASIQKQSENTSKQHFTQEQFQQKVSELKSNPQKFNDMVAQLREQAHEESVNFSTMKQLQHQQEQLGVQQPKQNKIKRQKIYKSIQQKGQGITLSSPANKTTPMAPSAWLLKHGTDHGKLHSQLHQAAFIPRHEQYQWPPVPMSISFTAPTSSVEGRQPPVQDDTVPITAVPISSFVPQNDIKKDRQQHQHHSPLNLNDTPSSSSPSSSSSPFMDILTASTDEEQQLTGADDMLSLPPTIFSSDSEKTESGKKR